MSTEQERFERWARSADGADPVPIVAAATVVLLRDTERGLETLMLRRDSRLAFAGGMWVFPGGRVDPGDFTTATTTDVATAGRNAAVREAAEEAGLVVDARLARPVRALDATARGAEAVLHRSSSSRRRRPAGDDRRRRDPRPHVGLPRRGAAPPRRARDRARAADVGDAPHPGGARDRRRRDRCDAPAPSPSTSRRRPRSPTRASSCMWHGDAGYEDGDAAREGARHRLWMVDTGWRYERTEPRRAPSALNPAGRTTAGWRRPGGSGGPSRRRSRCSGRSRRTRAATRGRPRGSRRLPAVPMRPSGVAASILARSPASPSTTAVRLVSTSPGRHAVDPDARCVLERRVHRQRDHARLRRGVRAFEPGRAHPAHRRVVDDRCRRASRMSGTAARIPWKVPARLTSRSRLHSASGVLVQRHRRPDPGVVEQHREPAERVGRVVDRPPCTRPASLTSATKVADAELGGHAAWPRPRRRR